MIRMFFFLASLMIVSHAMVAQIYDKLNFRIEKEVEARMRAGDIPGLSLILIKDGKTIIKTFGYADLEMKVPVTHSTLFEIGSCSKAFTALAVWRLVDQDLVELDQPVSKYLPWFRVTYKDQRVEITLRQLLHHTSGIPWHSISRIPETNADNALEMTVRTLIGTELNRKPGKEYEYATINYDVLALIIEKVTGKRFETFLQQHVINVLGLQNTTVGAPTANGVMAQGYKIGFFKPMRYDAPVFKGNNAAGYVISNAQDISSWLNFQMGLVSSHLYPEAELTHQRDETVPLHGMSAYGMGWEISLSGNREIYHGGLNPNFTAYLVFRQPQKLGVAVLANSNSGYTRVIAANIMKLMAGEEIKDEFDPGDRYDKAFSIISIIAVIYLLAIGAFLCLMVYRIVKEKRKLEPFSMQKLKSLATLAVVLMPCLVGIYLIPWALSQFTWSAILVWMPVSTPIALGLIIISIAVTYLVYAVSVFYPEKQKIRRLAPWLILVSMLTGLANMVIIILITSSLNTTAEIKYMLFYYGLAVSVYLLGRRFVQINLVKLSRELTYDLRVKLIDKIFSTSYEKFEAIDRGRVYTALNDDVSTLGDSTNTFIVLTTSLITTIGAFLYLSTIAFWATLVTLLLVGAIAIVYYFVTNTTRPYFEAARTTRDVFMRLTNGFIDGFKELSLHRQKKNLYKEEIGGSANEYRSRITTANVRFVNAFLVGELLFVSLLGGVAFAIPKLFPEIFSYTVMSFLIILLYLIGPINGILNSMPAIMQFKVSLRRINQFLNEIPANLDLNLLPPALEREVKSLRLNELVFSYKKSQDVGRFSIGPIDLEVKSGEILFIVGGNGSGKTTLAKLLTGLYDPDEGHILINNKEVRSDTLGEYFSTAFNPSHLFEKIYDKDVKEKSAQIRRYLDVLDLTGKVTVVGNTYSTTSLSTGQRKRLALLQCYLEDSPIYLFDEWAADQDPEYRNFFYRYLLPEMRATGKIVIAITHDEHYFDVADKLMKMDQGQLTPIRIGVSAVNVPVINP